MISFINAFALWLADYYLLSTVLLAFALVALLAIKQPAKRRAVTQFTLISLIVLATLCALPGWSAVHLLSAAPQQQAQGIKSSTLRPNVEQLIQVVPKASSPMRSPELVTSVEPAPNISTPARDWPNMSWPAAIATVHLGGSAGILIWLFVGLLAGRLLRLSATPAPATLTALLAELAAPRRPVSPKLADPSFGETRLSEVELLVSNRIAVPVALGILRPAILLPTSWLTDSRQADEKGLPLDQFRSVLAHELTHLRNRDLHWLALSRALNILLWAQPLFWFVRRRIRLDQEALADAAAAELTSRQHYAEQLVAWAHAVSARPKMHFSSAVGLWESPSQLRQRIAILIDDHFTVLRHCPRRWRLSAAFLALAAAACLSLITLEAKTQAETTPTNNASENNPATENTTAPVAVDKKTPTATPVLKVDIDSLRVRIVDSAGNPIEHATVKPYGLRLAARRGDHYGWFKEQPGFSAPQESKSDQSGIATVQYPRFIVRQAQMKTSTVSVQVSHPDHVTTSQDVEVSPNPTTIRLPSGGTVEIVVTSNGKAIRDDIFAQGGGWGTSHWKRIDDGILRSPRIMPGNAAVRAVYLPKDGTAQFSRLTVVEVAENQTQKIEVELQPGVRLTGKLDDSVPRPIKNGKVIAMVAMSGSVDWCDWAPVQEDGTYEFVSLPRNEAAPPQPAPDENGWLRGPDANVNGAQLIAIVDGFVSKPPQWDLGDRTGKPQVVPLDGDSVSHDIPMLATATVKLLFTEADGRPIPDAHVSFAPNIHWSIGSNLFGENAFRTGEVLRDPAVSPATSADSNKFHVTSNEKGLAEIKDLPPFEPHMAFIGHEQFQLPTSAMMMAGLARAATVDLKPGEVTELELVLEPTPDEVAAQQVTDTELVGTVLGPNGRPLKGVTVDVWSWHPGNETKTDARGRFRLKGFEPNEELEVEFRKEGYEPRHVTAQQAGSQGWSIQMDNRTFLEGVLTDPEGKIVANAEIRTERGPFENPNVSITEVETNTRTDADGHYKLFLEPDTYSIKVRAPGRGIARFESQQIAAGEQKKLDIKLKQSLTFQAKVVDSETGQPVEGFVLWNWRLKGIEGTSNAGGLLEVPDLYPGKFEFNVTTAGIDRLRDRGTSNYARWWSEQALHPHQRKELNSGGGWQRNFDDLEFEISEQAEPVTIFVERCAKITGRVLDPDGKPVAGATVTAAKTGTGNSLTGDTRFSYDTKEDGTFEMKLPASGAAKYNLVAHDGKFGEWRNWANAEGEPFTTKPGEHVKDVELRLARPATIRGRVMIDETPAVGKEVGAADVGRLDNRYYIPKTKTDDEGRFELKFVGPGKQAIELEWAWLNADVVPNGAYKHIEVEEGATIDDVELQVKTQPNAQIPFPAGIKVQ